MSNDTPDMGEPGGDARQEADQQSGEVGIPASSTGLETGQVEPSDAAPDAPQAPVPPPATEQEPGSGTRRVTRETHTSTTRSQTTTHETSTTVEDILLAPPVYAAPAGEHPRPVG